MRSFSAQQYIPEGGDSWSCFNSFAILVWNIGKVIISETMLHSGRRDRKRPARSHEPLLLAAASGRLLRRDGGILDLGELDMNSDTVGEEIDDFGEFETFETAPASEQKIVVEPLQANKFVVSDASNLIQEHILLKFPQRFPNAPSNLCQNLLMKLFRGPILVRFLLIPFSRPSRLAALSSMPLNHYRAICLF